MKENQSIQPNQSAQSINGNRLTPDQEELLIKRYNELIEGDAFAYQACQMTFTHLISLYADTISDGKPVIAEAYAIGIERIKSLLDVTFH